LSRKKSNIWKMQMKSPQDMGVAPTNVSAEPVEVVGLAAGGRGVARSRGRVWFVADGLPGDVVEIEPTRVRPRFGEARVRRFVSRSTRRRAASCPHQGDCGGCPWMPLDDSAQLEWKRRLVDDALRRIGHLTDVEPRPAQVVSPPLGYRNKVELHLFRDDGGRLRIGMARGRGEGGMTPVDRCPVQHREADALLSTAASWAAARPAGSTADRDWRVVLRRAWSTGQLLVLLREGRTPFPDARRLAAALMESHDSLVGVVRVRQRARRRGGARVEPLAGRDWIEERVAGLPLRVPANAFLQVNGPALEPLIERVAAHSAPVREAKVLDLYGGVGLYSFALLRAGAARATVCDADPAALACGRSAARRAGIRGIRFRRGDVARLLEETRPGSISHAVANPPRAGLGPVAVRHLVRLAPPRLVLVSCDPATLARDLRGLVEGGYRIETVEPLDLFPQTAHVETVVALSR
jgi:23S rRNA (uracil1939-C5)-methyltransferase